MKNVVTRKSDVYELLEPCILAYHQNGISASVDHFSKRILNRRVKFPLLEFCAHQLSENIHENEQLSFCDQIEALKTEGGNVILGIMLQNRLKNHFQESIEKATEYTSKADIWYVCDLIGERVFGHALLHHPAKTIQQLHKLSNHPKNWVVRSIGAGIHYAVKKGMDQKNTTSTFLILLSKANSKDKEIRQGIGWAAKTTARFHPTIIEQYHLEINDQEKVANWFRKKISIGLERHQYAKRNSS